MTTATGEVIQEDVLAVLSPDQRAVYKALDDGLAGLETKLPAKLETPEEQELAGDVIARAKKAKAFSEKTFKSVVEPSNAFIKAQRAVWKPLAERAGALVAKATGLVDALLASERQKREDDERAARELVAQKQKEQAAAEAKAQAAETPEEADEAQKEAEQKWNETRKAVSELDKAPVQTSVKLGAATVYESKTLDFELLDMAAFASAHPELVEIRRAPLLKQLRDATSGMTELPETLAGWPGLRLKYKSGRSAR